MGTYLNPGNHGFSGIRNDIYVDKSGLIHLINDTIDTPRRLTCISRPRRFGKSFAAQMLCAYYDKTCDSSELFDDLKIAAHNRESYEKYRNKYDVIYLDITNIIGEIAYFSYKDYYLKFEELPAGDGYADLVYFPKKTTALPALVIELKWKKSAQGAIAQIKEKRYPDALQGYDKDVLLVGISYNVENDKRKHTCVIEKMLLS